MSFYWTRYPERARNRSHTWIFWVLIPTKPAQRFHDAALLYSRQTKQSIAAEANHHIQKFSVPAFLVKRRLGCAMSFQRSVFQNSSSKPLSSYNQIPPREQSPGYPDQITSTSLFPTAPGSRQDSRSSSYSNTIFTPRHPSSSASSFSTPSPATVPKSFSSNSSAIDQFPPPKFTSISGSNRYSNQNVHSQALNSSGYLDIVGSPHMILPPQLSSPLSPVLPVSSSKVNAATHPSVHSPALKTSFRSPVLLSQPLQPSSMSYRDHVANTKDDSSDNYFNPASNLSIYNNNPSSPATDASNKSQQQPRQRSRKGCYTCRRRKKRCDEVKPVCSACVRLKLECLYPIPGQERKNRKRKSLNGPLISDTETKTENTITTTLNPNQDGNYDSSAKRNNSPRLSSPSVALLLNDNHDNNEPLLSVNSTSLNESSTLAQPNPKRQKRSIESSKSQGSSPENCRSGAFALPALTDLSPEDFSELNDDILSRLDPKSSRHSSKNKTKNDKMTSQSSSLHNQVSESLNQMLPDSQDFQFDTQSAPSPFSNPKLAMASNNSVLDTNSLCPSPLTAALNSISASVFSNDFSNDSTHNIASVSSDLPNNSTTTGNSNNTNNNTNNNNINTNSNNDINNENNNTNNGNVDNTDNNNNVVDTSYRSQSPLPSPSSTSFYLFHPKLFSSILASPHLSASRSPRIEELCNNDDEEIEFMKDLKEKGKSLRESGSSSSSSSRIAKILYQDDNISPCSKPREEHAEEEEEEYQLNISFNNGNDFQAGDKSLVAQESILTVNPKPWYHLHLDGFGIEMFAYYNNYLANMICISSKMNSFINVFVPMAEQDQSVLYALVAYASFHHTMGRYEDVGLRYLNKAIKMVRRDLPKNRLTTLASILIIATAEICKGDMVHWNRHLTVAADLIHMRGGMSTFTNDTTKRWLATNFVYHDLLAASKYEHKPQFEPKEYENILNLDEGVHTLIGCCKPIFGLLAEISELAVEAQEVYDAVAAENIEFGSENIPNSFASSSAPSNNDTGTDSTPNAERSKSPFLMPESFLSSKFHKFNFPKSDKPNRESQRTSDDTFSATRNAESSNSSTFSEYLKTNPIFSQRRISDRVRELHHRVELLEAKIDSCKPDPNDILSLSKSKSDLEEQLTLFETFQLTAKIHLYQSIGRRNVASLQLQVLNAELITSLDVILDTKVEGSLLFPLFIAAISSTTVRRRTEMVARFDMLYKRQLARNIVRALNLAEEVWKLDDNGTKYVNWYNVLKKNGWDICFS